MKLTPRAPLGALALCVALSLTACSTTGPAPKPPLPPKVVVKPKIVEAPKRQLVPIERTLTETPKLAPAPAPAIAPGEECGRPKGCYSNRQLEAMLQAALDWGAQAVDNLRSIRKASDEATSPSTKDPP